MQVLNSEINILTIKICYGFVAFSLIFSYPLTLTLCFASYFASIYATNSYIKYLKHIKTQTPQNSSNNKPVITSTNTLVKLINHTNIIVKLLFGELKASMAKAVSPSSPSPSVQNPITFGTLEDAFSNYSILHTYNQNVGIAVTIAATLLLNSWLPLIPMAIITSTLFSLFVSIPNSLKLVKNSEPMLNLNRSNTPPAPSPNKIKEMLIRFKSSFIELPSFIQSVVPNTDFIQQAIPDNTQSYLATITSAITALIFFPYTLAIACWGIMHKLIIMQSEKFIDSLGTNAESTDYEISKKPAQNILFLHFIRLALFTIQANSGDLQTALNQYEEARAITDNFDLYSGLALSIASFLIIQTLTLSLIPTIVTLPAALILFVTLPQSLQLFKSTAETKTLPNLSPKPQQPKCISTSELLDKLIPSAAIQKAKELSSNIGNLRHMKVM